MKNKPLGVLQIVSIISHNKHDLQKELIERSGNRPIQETLILVANQLMVRHLRRILQKSLSGFAPKIMTLESWLDELAEISFTDEERPDQILSPKQERPLVLDDWIRNHTDKRITRFRGSQSIDIISNIIGDMRRAGLPLNSLIREVEKEHAVQKNPDFAYLLKEYEHMLQDRNWIDRELLPLKISKVPPIFLKEQQIILYELDYVFESQKAGLKKIFSQLGDKSVVHIQYEPEGNFFPVTVTNWLQESAKKRGWPYQKNQLAQTDVSRISQKLKDNEILSDGELYTALKAKRLHIESYHDVRTELVEVLRRIRWNVAQTVDGEIGSLFSDYAILVGNLPDYQALAANLSEQYEVPVYCTRGPILGSHPIVRRFMTMLSLELNDFQIDDIYQVFADNQFKLSELKEDNEMVTPNIRSFCQFCRKYNLRNLSEAGKRLEHIVERGLRQIDDDKVYRDEQRRLKDRKELLNNAEYYKKIIHILEHYRKQFDISQKKKLTDWVTWGKEQIQQQQNLGSTVANQARQDLENVLDNVLLTHERLGLHPDLKMGDFIEVVMLALEGERESNPDQPDAVLLSDATYYTDIHDKITFLLGMNEGAFPRPVKTDFLRFRYQKEFNALLRDRSPESFMEARHHLQRQLDNARKLYLSRYRVSGQSQVIGSALWQDIAHILHYEDNTIQDKWAWEKLPVDIITSGYDWRRYQAGQVNLSVYDWWNTSQEHTHHQLVAAIEWERSHRKCMGIYDGVMQPWDLGSEFQLHIQNQVESWWQRKVSMDGSYRSSISRLDEYANSPLEYFFNRVLRLQPLAQYHDDAESDVKGSILHKILQEFYTPDSRYALANKILVDPAREDIGRAQKRIAEIADNVLDEYSDQMGYPDSPFPSILRESMLRILNGFLKNEQSQQDLLREDIWEVMRPATFHSGSSYTMEYHWEVPLEIDGIDEQVVLNGFIDRIDTDSSGKKAIVYDYKSGSGGIKHFDEDIIKGLSFQLPVYGHALLANGVDRFAGAYYYLPVDSGQNKIEWKGFMGDLDFYRSEMVYNQRGKNKLKKEYRGLMPMSEVRSFLDELLNTRVAQIINLVRKGVFNLSVIGQKPYSDFKMITRYNRQIQNERRRIETELQKREQAKKRYYLPLELDMEEEESA
jgi:ATP-dependent helicase/DNAse subunit B